MKPAIIIASAMIANNSLTILYIIFVLINTGKMNHMYGKVANEHVNPVIRISQVFIVILSFRKYFIITIKQSDSIIIVKKRAFKKEIS